MRSNLQLTIHKCLSRVGLQGRDRTIAARTDFSERRPLSVHPVKINFYRSSCSYTQTRVAIRSVRPGKVHIPQFVSAGIHHRTWYRPQPVRPNPVFPGIQSSADWDGFHVSTHRRRRGVALESCPELIFLRSPFLCRLCYSYAIPLHAGLSRLVELRKER